MLKRIMSIIFCVLLLGAMMSVPAFAERAETVNFSLIANDAKAGESVIVTVSIPENSYFTNATLLMHYDPAVMTYVTDSAAGGAISPSGAWVLSNDFADKGYVKAVYVTIDGIVEGGELLTFEFTAKSEAPAQFSLTFDECIGVDENGVEFEVNYTTEPVVVNSDGSVMPTMPVITTTTAPAEEEGGINTTVLLIVVGVAVVLVAGVTAVMVFLKKKS